MPAHPVDHKKAEGLLEREDKIEVQKNKAIVLIKEISWPF